MSLMSQMLRGEPRLQACLTQDSCHLVQGVAGPCVAKVQLALLVLDGLSVAPDETRTQRYGPSTAAAVLAFKKKRNIINRSYETRPDDIVGKMTIAALDREMLRKENAPHAAEPPFCGNCNRNRSESSGVSTSSSMLAVGFTTGAGETLPSDVAKTRIQGAISMVGKAQFSVSRLMTFRKHPIIPAPPGLPKTWDDLWDSFGLPEFPKNDPLSDSLGTVLNIDDYLSVVKTVLDGCASNLARAATLFREPLAEWYPAAHAFTLSGKRAEQDPKGWPDGIYVNPRFLHSGPITQTRVIAHECGHFVNNAKITDIAPQTLSYAHGYSNFELLCAFGRIPDDNE